MDVGWREKKEGWEGQKVAGQDVRYHIFNAGCRDPTATIPKALLVFLGHLGCCWWECFDEPWLKSSHGLFPGSSVPGLIHLCF